MDFPNRAVSMSGAEVTCTKRVKKRKNKPVNIKSSEAGENYYEKLDNSRGAYKLQIDEVR